MYDYPTPEDGSVSVEYFFNTKIKFWNRLIKKNRLKSKNRPKRNKFHPTFLFIYFQLSFSIKIIHCDVDNSDCEGLVRLVLFYGTFTLLILIIAHIEIYFYYCPTNYRDSSPWKTTPKPTPTHCYSSRRTRLRFDCCLLKLFRKSAANSVNGTLIRATLMRNGGRIWRQITWCGGFPVYGEMCLAKRRESKTDRWYSFWVAEHVLMMW